VRAGKAARDGLLPETHFSSQWPFPPDNCRLRIDNSTLTTTSTVAVGGHQDTGGDAYDTLGSATCVALSSRSPSTVAIIHSATVNFCILNSRRGVAAKALSLIILPAVPVVLAGGDA